MAFVQAKCPECGGMLAVDESKKQQYANFAEKPLLFRKQLTIT